MAERKLDPDDFPSNSNTKKERDDNLQNKSVQKVVSGKVVQKKKPLSKRFKEVFLGDNIDNVKEYIFIDVLIPAIKNTFSEMVSQGVEMLLFGESQSRGNRVRREGNKSYVSYSSYYNDKSTNRKERHPQARRNMHSFDDILFEKRVEAENVLSSLVDLVVDYEQASVADLYDLCGLESVYTDNHYGWTDLKSASISRVREGYILNLPKAYPID